MSKQISTCGTHRCIIQDSANNAVLDIVAEARERLPKSGARAKRIDKILEVLGQSASSRILIAQIQRVRDAR